MARYPFFIFSVPAATLSSPFPAATVNFLSMGGSYWRRAGGPAAVGSGTSMPGSGVYLTGSMRGSLLVLKSSRFGVRM